MRRVLQTLATLAAAGVVLGVAVVLLGFYNVSARVGHLPGVSWLLHSSFQASVRLRAPPAEATPDLSDPGLIALGARHYDSACSGCHAAPGRDRTATIRAMVPVPPHISEAVASWEPNELFWIVREGVKMTGMPHWPSPAADEEVWSVVAFLEALDSLSAEDYGRLVARSEPTPFGYCASCHGADGRSRIGHVPRLDILDAGSIEQALIQYRRQQRNSGIMQHAASTVDPGTLATLARRFGAMPSVALTAGADAPDPVLDHGRSLALARGRDGDVPACAACHGPDAEPRDEPYPALAGQHQAYLERQLRMWRAGERGGGPRAHVMRRAAAELTDADIAALAAWYASLPATPKGQ